MNIMDYKKHTSIIKTSIVECKVAVVDTTKRRQAQVWKPFKKIVEKNIWDENSNGWIRLGETKQGSIN